MTGQDKTLFLNKKCRIGIIKEGKRLHFTAKILEYTDQNIIFIDKFDGVYSFNSNLVQEISTINEGGYTND